MEFKKFKQRGQVLVFYALMIPLLLLFAGAGLDLGWYYLNVSRLQNAADAAALAGAQALIKTDDDFKNYYVRTLSVIMCRKTMEITKRFTKILLKMRTRAN